MCIAHTLDWGIVIGAVITAFGALFVSTQWKREQIGKRKFELAEKALTAASICSECIKFARSPISYSGEGQTRELSDKEKASGRNSTKDTYYSKIERLDYRKDEFNALAEAYHVFCAHEGRETVSPAFEPFFQVRNHIKSAVWQLMSAIDDESTDPNFRQSMQSVIWEGYPKEKDDEINPKLETAMQQMEKLCAPYLGRAYKKTKKPSFSKLKNFFKKKEK